MTGDAGAGWPAARVATVAVLLAVAVIGLRARGTFSHQASSSLAGAGSTVTASVLAIAEGAGLVAWLIVLALVLRRPRRRKPEDEAHVPYRPPLPWWAKPLITLFALAMLAAPWIILLAGRNTRNGTTTLAPLRPPVPRPGAGQPVPPPGSSLTWPLLAGVLLAVAAVLTLAILTRRRRHQDRPPTRERAPAPAGLAEGLAAGREALLAAGYAAAGLAGLADAATIAAAGVLVLARGTVRGEEPQPVRTGNRWRNRHHAPAVSTAEFPAYRKIASDLSWAVVSRRQYEYSVRPMLARLAAALDRPDTVARDLAGPPDADGPGVDLATLDGIVTRLEEDR